MTSFSKFFDSEIRNKRCHDLIHPSTSSCNRAWFNIIRRIVPTTLHLMFPILVVSFANKTSNYSWQDVIDSIVQYLKFVGTSFGTVTIAFRIMCLLNKLFGKFYQSTLAVVPYVAGSLITLLLPKSSRIAHALLFFNFILEAYIKNSKIGIIKIIRSSKIMSILLFMCISASIMFHLKANEIPIFWFVSPTKRNLTLEDKNKQSICDHSDICEWHVLEGFLIYGKYGIGLEIIKRIFASINLIKTNPLKFLRNTLASTNYDFAAFIIAYGVLYRLSNCVINRKFGGETSKTSMTAGFIAGAAFYFNPNYYFFTYGFSTMVQLIWHTLGTSHFKGSLSFKTVYNLPWSSIVYGISGGLMIHIRLFKPRLLPKMAVKISDKMTAGLLQLISDKIRLLSSTTNISRF